jgi:hypothetical protein
MAPGLVVRLVAREWQVQNNGADIPVSSSRATDNGRSETFTFTWIIER